MVRKAHRSHFKYGSAKICIWVYVPPCFLHQADEIYKICSIIGTPTQQNWSEGLKLAQAMNFRFPQFAPTPLSKLIPHACPEAVDLMNCMLHWDPNKRLTAVQCLQVIAGIPGLWEDGWALGIKPVTGGGDTQEMNAIEL
jgi:hypothetical protein